MALVKLQTQNFRNLAPTPVTFSPSFNLLYGANGSGKSSVLEAIGYLGLGRSFRVTRHQAVVSHGQSRLTVFGGLDSGLTVDRKSTRLNSSHVRISYAVFCLKKKRRRV